MSNPNSKPPMYKKLVLALLLLGLGIVSGNSIIVSIGSTAVVNAVSPSPDGGDQ